jgi:hypothetical protein
MSLGCGSDLLSNIRHGWKVSLGKKLTVGDEEKKFKRLTPGD